MKLTISKELVPSLAKVEKQEERVYYWNKLLVCWGVHSKRSFPGCNPCSLSRADLAGLATQEYTIALKSDGVRYALYLTLRKHDQSPIALMIDRSQNMYEVEVVAAEKYFVEGTILEGELVWKQPDEEKLIFMVWDAICVKGTKLTSLPFVERLDAARQCTQFSDELNDLLQVSTKSEVTQRISELDCIAMVHYSPTVTMRPKRFVARCHAEKLWAERGESGHRVDGIVLHRSDAAYICGTSKRGAVLKWKEHSTIDLFGDDVLRASDGPLDAEYHGRPITVQLDSRLKAESGDVMEYGIFIDDECIRLCPVRKRPDKTTANALRVIRATIEDVFEGIEVHELSTA